MVHAGDIFSGKNLPLLDANNGGSGVAIGDTLAKAAKSLKNIDTVITGHSTTMTMADLAEYAEFNKDFMKEVQAGKKAGKTRGRHRQRLEDAREVQGLRRAGRPGAGAAEGQRADRHGRDEITCISGWCRPRCSSARPFLFPSTRRRRARPSRSRRRPAATSFPRTAWGDPDLNGIWPSIDMVRVPVQRAPQYGTRLFMTADEHAVLEKREQEQIVRMAADGAGGATGAPGHWVEWGKTQLQTSLLVDPPDGRMPPMTPAGQARTAAAPKGTLFGAQLDSPDDFSMWERCISRGALGSTLPVLYNSGIDITQGPGFVAIRYEMIHDYRIIPLGGRPHCRHPSRTIWAMRAAISKATRSSSRRRISPRRLESG